MRSFQGLTAAVGCATNGPNTSTLLCSFSQNVRGSRSPAASITLSNAAIFHGGLPRRGDLGARKGAEEQPHARGRELAAGEQMRARAWSLPSFPHPLPPASISPPSSPSLPRFRENCQRNKSPIWMRAMGGRSTAGEPNRSG
jgi:hypothetical protein